MADRLIREGSPPSGLLASPVPQYWNPAADAGAGAYEKVLGVNGASRVLLWGSNNQPLLTETNAGYVRAADGALATIGALADAAQTSPTAEASVVALLKGVLTRLQAGADGAAPSDVVDRAARELGRISAVDGAIDALGTLADAAVTDPATSGAVIGLLKGLLQTLRTDGAQVQLSGSIDALTEPQTSDLVRRAYDAIIDAVGGENIALLLPMWEDAGEAVLSDLLRPYIKFAVQGSVTLGSPGLMHSVPRFTNGACVQAPVVANIVPETTAKTITSASHKVAQRLTGIALSAGLARLRMRKVGDLTSATAIRFAVYDDNAGVPGTLLANGLTLAMHGGHLTASYTLNGLPWETPPGMRLDSAYWLVAEIESSTELGATNYIEFAAAAGGDGCATFDGTQWDVDGAASLVFDLYDDALQFPNDGISIVVAGNLSDPVRSGRALLGTSSTSINSLYLGHSPLGAIVSEIRAPGVLQAVGHRWPTSADHIYGMTCDYAADAEKLKLYLDGLRVASADGTAGAAMLYPHQPWSIGASTYPDGTQAMRWFGTIGPVLMVRGALTPSQVAEVSNQMLVLRKARHKVV